MAVVFRMIDNTLIKCNFNKNMWHYPSYFIWYSEKNLSSSIYAHILSNENILFYFWFMPTEYCLDCAYIRYRRPLYKIIEMLNVINCTLFLQIKRFSSGPFYVSIKAGQGIVFCVSIYIVRSLLFLINLLWIHGNPATKE